jgi:hypothetical protein
MLLFFNNNDIAMLLLLLSRNGHYLFYKKTLAPLPSKGYKGSLQLLGINWGDENQYNHTA